MSNHGQALMADDGHGARIAASTVLPKLRLGLGAANSVQTVRNALATEFEPRASRALQIWPVRTRTDFIADLNCQVVEPADGAVNRIILHFFGGGYVSGKPEYDLPITAALATLSQAQVIVPRYSLAPEYPYPRAFNQAISVYRAISAREVDLPIAFSGESAGGGLACALTIAACQPEAKKPNCLTLFSPWVDLSKEGIAQTQNREDPTLSTDQLAWFAAAYHEGADARGRYVSPSLADLPANWPATFLTTATGDLLQPNVQAFANKLKEQHVNVRLIEVEGHCHVFEVYDECGAALPTLRSAAEFIVENTSEQPLTTFHGR